MIRMFILIFVKYDGWDMKEMIVDEDVEDVAPPASVASSPSLKTPSKD